MQILRDYQARGLASVMDAWRGGARTVLGVLPTGGGKTSLFTTLTRDLDAANKRVLILVHRRELASQACNRLREFGVHFGLIMAGEAPRPHARVQVASVQTIIRRAAPPADLVICDEAHLSTATSWQTVLDNYPRARILGVTATPWRLTGKPLAGAYDAAVVMATPTELREQGHLSRYVGFSYLTPDLSDVASVGGEYNEQQTAKKMSDSLIVDNIVDEWLKHARELSTVVFAVTVEHSQQIAARFREAGIRAEHLDGSTPLELRRAILRRVDRGDTQVLCNVGVAVEGLDIPRLKCCVLARPTKSVSRAIQMMGRVRRPWQGVTARIHDHAFVIKQHGLPDQDRDYSLHAKPEKPPSLSTCATCFALYMGNACPSCGAEREVIAVERGEMQTVADAEQVTFSDGDEEQFAKEHLPPVSVQWTRVGREVEGRYEGHREERSPYGPQRVYRLIGAKRDYDLPGTVRLNALMSRVNVGDLVRVTFTGETPLHGDRVRKEFKLEVDDGQPPADCTCAVSSRPPCGACAP